MRYLLIALLVALLPLRSTAGDAMAVAMLVHPATAAQIQVQAQVECPDTAATPHEAATPAADTHPHLSCSICNGPAMADWRPAGVAPVPTRTLLTPTAVHFASTEPQQDIKPPIS